MAAYARASNRASTPSSALSTRARSTSSAPSTLGRRLASTSKERAVGLRSFVCASTMNPTASVYRCSVHAAVMTSSRWCSDRSQLSCLRTSASRSRRRRWYVMPSVPTTRLSLAVPSLRRLLDTWMPAREMSMSMSLICRMPSMNAW